MPATIKLSSSRVPTPVSLSRRARQASIHAWACTALGCDCSATPPPALHFATCVPHRPQRPDPLHCCPTLRRRPPRHVGRVGQDRTTGGATCGCRPLMSSPHARGRNNRGLSAWDDTHDMVATPGCGGATFSVTAATLAPRGTTQERRQSDDGAYQGSECGAPAGAVTRPVRCPRSLCQRTRRRGSARRWARPQPRTFSEHGGRPETG